MAEADGFSGRHKDVFTALIDLSGLLIAFCQGVFRVARRQRKKKDEFVGQRTDNRRIIPAIYVAQLVTLNIATTCALFLMHNTMN